MTYGFNWKTGILSSLATVIVGGALFIFVASPIDFSCANATHRSAGCRVYSGINAVVQGYADFWRQFFAPNCVGGVGSDDCIGPDAMILVTTLALGGLAVGGSTKRRSVPRNESIRKNVNP